MIIARFEKDEAKKEVRMSVSGHAESAPEGDDLVCAAASILSYSLAQHFINLANDKDMYYKPKTKLDKGNAKLSLRAKRCEGFAVLSMSCLPIYSGFVLLMANYPENISVEGFGVTEKTAD